MTKDPNAESPSNFRILVLYQMPLFIPTEHKVRNNCNQKQKIRFSLQCCGLLR